MVRSNKRVVPLWGAVIALVVFCWSSSVLGQAVTGTLLGTVTDTSGAAVTGARGRQQRPQQGLSRFSNQRKRQLFVPRTSNREPMR